MLSRFDSSRFSTSRGSGSRFGGGVVSSGTVDADMIGEASSVFVRTSGDVDDGAPVELMRRAAAYLRVDIPPETISGSGVNSLIIEVPDGSV